MTVSPLRYPGGKAKLFPFFSQLINSNSLFGCHYCEPYAGGAGLALKLLVDGFVDSAAINDIDCGIFSFWKSVFHTPDELCSRIERLPITIEEWKRQKRIWSRNDVSKPLELGLATYFLNRTNRSGIISGAGPIGGFDQCGKWKIDARFNKTNLISNILSISKLSNKITITNLDALVFIKENLNRKKTLIYLDPPYYEKGQKLYTNFYNHNDHLVIASSLKRVPSSNWVVSYDQAPEIRDAYSDFRCIEYNLNYSAATKTVGSEYIFLSDTLELPNVQGFRLAA